MKLIFISFLSVILNDSCEINTLQELKGFVAKNDTAWLNSWEHDPLNNLIKIHIKQITPYNYDGFYGYPDSLNAPFYVYSPSKKYCVDIYTRTMYIKDSILHYFDIDSEVILNDIEKGISIRLDFYGSTGYFDEIRWMSDSSLLVFGASEGCPEISWYDIKNFRYSYFKSSRNIKKYNYIVEKFKRMKVIVDINN